MNTRNLNHSRPLDVHRWSDYPEVNNFVDHIFSKYFSDFTNKKTKKHLKVILLDLYLCWLEDEEKSLGIGMSNSFYNDKSRYNSLHISNLMIKVVHRLSREDLIGLHPGSESAKKVTRIWAEELLIKKFKEAAIDQFMVVSHEDRETVILKDNEKKLIEYRDDELTETDAAKVQKMRELLKEYNDALHNTFIDIPTLDKGYIENVTSGRDEVRHSISHHHKFVYRVFNNGSFRQGGRFYGGWWQNIPKAYRKDIFIDDQSTVEIDFKAIHIKLLYAQLGLEIDEELRGDDAYTIEIPFTDDDEEARQIGKMLLLICINAKDEYSALKAFRSGLVNLGYGKVGLKDKDLTPLIQSLKDKHPKIQSSFCSNAGIHLMNIDAEIAALVLEDCLYINLLPLIIHDSFIINSLEEEQLRLFMKDAVTRVVSSTSAQTSLIKNEDLYASEFRSEEIERIKTTRYKHNLNIWNKLERSRKLNYYEDFIPELDE
jgi:hypothetical protein